MPNEIRIIDDPIPFVQFVARCRGCGGTELVDMPPSSMWPRAQETWVRRMIRRGMIVEAFSLHNSPRYRGCSCPRREPEGGPND